MKKSVKAILGVLCALIILVFLAGIAVPTYFATRHRAVIVVPGLLNSALYNEKTGEVIYDPIGTDTEGYLLDDILYGNGVVSVALGAIVKTDILNDIMDFIDGKEPIFLSGWWLDDEGNALENIVAVPFSHDGYARYGALQATRVPYDYCLERFGSEKNTDVLIYEYDWRADTRKAVDGLCEMAKGYDEVVLYAHSMGNIVSSLAIAQNKEFRKKVVLNMACAAPYYGSYVALDILENGAETINGLFDMAEGAVSSLPAAISKAVSGLIAKLSTARERVLNYVLPMFQGYPAMAQLLPTIEQVCPDGENSSLVVDGKPIKTREELLSYYRSRKWAYDKNGKMRPWIADLDEFWEASYVNGVHASKLVNTHYVVGENCYTIIGAEQNGDHFRSLSEKNGDGTVPFLSATLGKGKTLKNASYLDGFDHIEVGHAFHKGLAEYFTEGEKQLELKNRIAFVFKRLFNKNK